MSYRAFKRLLGETSLERKCLCLYGIGTLVLISSIFWFYANQAEALAYKQTAATGRVLALHLFSKHHEKILETLAAAEENKANAKPGPKKAEKDRELLQHALDALMEENLPELLKKYQTRVIKPNALNREN